jgi:hypothetical protein
LRIAERFGDDVDFRRTLSRVKKKFEPAPKYQQKMHIDQLAADYLLLYPIVRYERYVRIIKSNALLSRSDKEAALEWARLDEEALDGRMTALVEVEREMLGDHPLGRPDAD